MVSSSMRRLVSPTGPFLRNSGPSSCTLATSSAAVGGATAYMLATWVNAYLLLKGSVFSTCVGARSRVPATPNVFRKFAHCRSVAERQSFPRPSRRLEATYDPRPRRLVRDRTPANLHTRLGAAF